MESILQGLNTVLLIVVIILLLISIVKKSSHRIQLNQDQLIDLSKTIESSQQEHLYKLQKSISEDFALLRENIVKNIAHYNSQTNKEMYDFQNKLYQEMEKVIKNLNDFAVYTHKELLKFQNGLNKDQNHFKDGLRKEINYHFERLNRNLDKNLEMINNKVETRLNEGLEKTHKTFNSILERLSKIDEAQKKIESLSTNIVSLQDILTDKKSRGTFGEIQLSQILSSIFGQNNQKIYENQKRLSNGSIVDVMLHTPEPLGHIAIDSKFPLENYKRMTEQTLSDSERMRAKRIFKQDLKKHIDDINSKYIIPNETATQAIMFIPAEAVFAEINAYHHDIIEYSQQKRVWITSPTTLMSLLTTVQVVLRNLERDKYTTIIHEELNKLGSEFKRYKSRWDKLSKNIDQVSKNVKELHTTSDKINHRFNSISKVDLEELNNSDYLDINN
ncbi:DNA recombination protein RmuC [Haloplasma contractile]|uniref:RmuC family protein n=1 Tax=Haloplasma contractile SSD-17B TaxID=1033810 RepID=F7PT43_9MOLU|nr:DNA recombination protein RmuC [Haloplasma contractile]ERJ12544.1 RmuC family protein [Haloplasma contractile SSD-17B]